MIDSIRRFFGKSIRLDKRVVILGIDGLDPGYLRRGIRQGRLPNFKKLANTGGFTPLGTTWMPLSPVAWSSFISGCNPGKHGIFDFLHRDPDGYEPHLSIARQHDSPRSIELGPYEFPLGSGSTEGGRKGPAFWRAASRQHVKTTVLRCPVSFPPEPVRGKMLSGLGVPDLNGTQGSFTFFTTNSSTDQKSRGGTVKIIDHPMNGTETVTVQGPPNPFLCDHPRTECKLKLSLSSTNLIIESSSFRLVLREGDWSDWKPLEFDFLGPFSVNGQVRFYLKSLRPEFELYCSPVNVSSDNPAFPISYPESYSSELRESVGPYHTLGLTADTGMLKEGRVEDGTFLEQAYSVLDERINMLKTELSTFDDGLFNCVFDIPDRIQHMFWRYEDEHHPGYVSEKDEQYGGTIRQVYERMDTVVGWVLDELNSRDDLVICSDHGFGSFRRQVDLNTWLLKKGYLSLQDGGSPADAGPIFHGVDWSRTKAYAIGLAGIYVNRRGRESEGIVPDDEAEELIQRITEELNDLRDQQEKKHPVSRALPSKEVYTGHQTGPAPDILVGYSEGYRISWDSAIGGFNGEVLSNNENKWSGDHGLDPSLIPGSLFANFPIRDRDIFLKDLVPGLFNRLGLDPHKAMDGSRDWIQS